MSLSIAFMETKGKGKKKHGPVYRVAAKLRKNYKLWIAGQSCIVEAAGRFEAGAADCGCAGNLNWCFSTLITVTDKYVQ